MTTRTILAQWQRAGITALIAYAMVLQALLVAFGGALHAEPSGPAPGFICSQASESGQSQGPASSHDALCCAWSCGVSGPPVGPLPAFAGILLRIPLPALGGSAPDEPFLRLASHVLPVGSRAPPRLG